MDMYEPVNRVPNGSRAERPRQFPTSAVTLIFLYLLWATLNAWSINLVSSGILAVKLVPTNLPEWAVFAFATGLQSCVGMFGLLTPLFFRPVTFLKTVFWLFALTVCIATTGFECFHAVYIQIKQSIGAGLYTVEESDLSRIHAQITNVTAQIRTSYQAKLQSQLSLADDAKAGRDRTGIAECGSICRANIEKYRTAKDRFTHLGMALVPLPAPTGANLRSNFADLQHRWAALCAAVASLSEFYAYMDGAAPPAMIGQAMTDIAEAISLKDVKYKNITTLDTTTLALEQTGQAFVAIASGNAPRLDTVLPIAYGLLPALCVLVVSIYIRRVLDVRTDPRAIYHLRQALRAEREAEPVLEHLATAREQNHRNWLRARLRRWDFPEAIDAEY